jgi:hypothetical protein
MIIELFVRFLNCEENLMVLTCVYKLFRFSLVDGGYPRDEFVPVLLAQTTYFVSSVPIL